MAFQSPDRELWLRRYGRPEAPLAAPRLTAGPLTGSMLGADIVDVRAAGVSIISRIGVRVRNPEWGTVVAEVLDASLTQQEDAFEATVRCISSDGEIELEWSGAITGERDGVIAYEMSGFARRPFEFARIGICVLHPARAYAGRPYKTRLSAEGRLPELVAPPERRAGIELPLFPSFSKFEVQLSSQLTVWLSSEGDLLELEDQRNWTDGSFKTYSSSVSDPLPRLATTGQRFHQLVKVGVGATSTRLARPSRGDHVEVSLGAPAGPTMPPIGAQLDRDRSEPSDVELAGLRKVGLAHIRVECRMGDGAARALARAASVVASLGAELELVAMAEPDTELALAELARARLPAPLARVIVVPPAPGVTSGQDVARLRNCLASWLHGIPVVGGTDSDFAELNASRPQLEGLDGIVFSMNPQVHETDEQALVESLIGQRDATMTAASFAQGLPVHVSPVTLRPRVGVLNAQPSPSSADPRQPTSFAAGWTVGSIRHLAESGAASITYYELTGPNGLMHRTSHALPGGAFWVPGEPYPVLRVLAHACAWRGMALLDVGVSDPGVVEAVAVATAAGTEGLIANLRPHAVVTTVTGDSLDGATVESLAPGSTGGGCRVTRVRGSRPELNLEPFSVVSVRP